MVIKIERHVCTDGTKLNQHMVFVDGKRVAYCGVAANQPLNFLLKKVHVEVGMEKAVMEAVTEKVGAPNKVSYLSEPPPEALYEEDDE